MRVKTKVFSGALLGKRKFLAVVGYGLAAFTPPCVIHKLAVAARFIDGIGKGSRGALGTH
jgi:hypothetical protein